MNCIQNVPYKGQTEILQKWWNYMADIMETNPDNSPFTTELEELFYME
jgi:L-rhamnose mutarotase